MKLSLSDIVDVRECVVCCGRDFAPVSRLWCEPLGAVVFATAYCPRCGSTFRTRHPRLEWFESQPVASVRDVYEPAWEAIRVHRYDQYARHLGRHLPRGASILDIGSNTGVGPRFLEELGYRVFGVEQDAKRVELSRALMHHPERVFCGSFEHYHSGERFDAVMLIHVLEHLHRPRELLAKVRSLLADGGVFYVEVPDLLSAIYHFDNFYVSHISNFTRASLAGLLQECGFEVIADLSRFHINAVGNAIGLLCRKSPPRPAAWRPLASFAQVCKLYAYRYHRRAPFEFRIDSLDETNVLMSCAYSFDAARGQMVPSKTYASPLVRLRPRQLVHVISLEHMHKLLGRYATVRYRRYLAEVERVVARLAAAEGGRYRSQISERTATR